MEQRDERESLADLALDAALTTPGATVSITRFDVHRPTDNLFRRDGHYYIDMCLTPRPERTRGCYAERWGPHRFERLGEIFVVPPGEALHIRSDAGGKQSSIVCELDASLVDRWLDDGIEWTGQRLAALLDIAHPYIRSCLFRLAEEARHPGAGRELLPDLVVQQLGIEVARYCRSVAEGPVAGGLASWRLRLIDERLRNPAPPPSLEELAALCNISVRQLTRGFRASRGCSIGDHVAQVRIEAAKRMLASPDNIGSIAYALGFSSLSSFSSAFRRATGSGPRQFRQRRYRKGD